MWLARSLCVALLLMVVVLTPRQTPAAEPGLSIRLVRPAALQPPSGREPRLLSAAPPALSSATTVTQTLYLPLLVMPPPWPITRVSVASDDAEGDSGSGEPSVSADGRFVAFASEASNLVSTDTNGTWDVFVHDRETRQTTRVSVASEGAEGDSGSRAPSISADGRFVAFASEASNLVPGDTNSTSDIFVHDRQTRQTSHVSIATDGGVGGNAGSSQPSISADGWFVAFTSWASNLVPDDTNGGPDNFVHDRQTGQTTRVSVAANSAETIYVSGTPSLSADGRFVAFSTLVQAFSGGDTIRCSDSGKRDAHIRPIYRTKIFVHDRQTGQTTCVSVTSENRGQDGPSISADGRFVAFEDRASNLWWNIFVHDRQTGQTTHVSVSSNGAEGNEDSWAPSLSADGRFVAFASEASTLVAGDTNGWPDIFVHDRQTRTTIRVNLSVDSAESNETSGYSALSANGRFVAFQSDASNLVADDTNGAGDIFVVALPAAP